MRAIGPFLVVAGIVAGCSCEAGGGGDAGPPRDGSRDTSPDVVVVSSMYGYCTLDGSPSSVPFRCADPAAQCLRTQEIVALCSVPCTTDADCPPAEGATVACVPFGESGQNMCVLRCEYMQPGQCYAGQSCNLRFMMRLCY